MKGTKYKIMFGLILKMFIRFLTDLANASNHAKSVSLRNKKFNLLLLIYILINTVKNYTTIYLMLN